MPAGQCVRTDWPEIPLDAQIDSSWSREHRQVRLIRQHEAHHSPPEQKFTVTECSRLPHAAQLARKGPIAYASARATCTIFLAISSGDRTKSTHPLAMALSGISG